MRSRGTCCRSSSRTSPPPWSAGTRRSCAARARSSTTSSATRTSSPRRPPRCPSSSDGRAATASRPRRWRRPPPTSSAGAPASWPPSARRATGGPRPGEAPCSPGALRTIYWQVQLPPPPAVQCRVLPQDPPQAAPVLQVCTQPVAGLQLSAVHAFPSLQFAAGPPTHVPLPLQVSKSVHALLSLHAVPAGTLPWGPQPSWGSHAAVWQVLPSLQFRASVWQNCEQPSQLTVFPSSHVSGNSTIPLPQVGHGTRQFVWPGAVHTGSTVWVGVGVMVPAPVNWFTLCTSVTLPSVPLELLLVALIGPLTVMSSRAVSVIAPPMPPARASTWPVAVTVTAHPWILPVLPLPQTPAAHPPALAVTVPLMVTGPEPPSPAVIEIEPPFAWLTSPVAERVPSVTPPRASMPMPPAPPDWPETLSVPELIDTSRPASMVMVPPVPLLPPP